MVTTLRGIKETTVGGLPMNLKRFKTWVIVAVDARLLQYSTGSFKSFCQAMRELTVDRTGETLESVALRYWNNQTPEFNKLCASYKNIV